MRRCRAAGSVLNAIQHAGVLDTGRAPCQRRGSRASARPIAATTACTERIDKDFS
jgi:hypothetical protein